MRNGPPFVRQAGGFYTKAALHGARGFAMRKVQRLSFRKFIGTLVTFLVFMSASILVFFYCVQKKAEKNVTQEIMKNVERQSYHFELIINQQYGYLEGLADHIGKQEELVTEDSLGLMGDLKNRCSLEYIIVYDKDGNGTYDNGETGTAADKEYFQKAIEGSRSLSDPIVSQIDGETRIVLGVPIRSGGEIRGVLGGAFSVDELKQILFQNMYDGEGFSVIVTESGDIVYQEDSRDYRGLAPEDNFFEYYEKLWIYEDSKISDVSEDFRNKKSGYIKVKDDGAVRYLVYASLGLGDWKFCYIVPVRKAEEGYRFIRFYEVILSAVLFLGIVVLFAFVWWENVKKQRELLASARTDDLTGACNKKHTEAEIEEWLEEAPLDMLQAFMMLDIDQFKQVNDQYGHVVGDEALRRVGRLLQEEFRDLDIIGRIGGDEFVVMMKNVRDMDIVRKRARCLCEEAEQIRIPDAKKCRITVSIGIACAPENGKSYKELYKRADKALYQTKENGRNGYTVYGTERD